MWNWTLVVVVALGSTILPITQPTNPTSGAWSDNEGFNLVREWESGASGDHKQNGSSSRHWTFEDLTDHRHFLVNVRDGSEIGRCRSVDGSGLQDIRSRDEGEEDWDISGNFSLPLCEPSDDIAVIDEAAIYRAAVRLLVHPGGIGLQPPAGSRAYVNAPTIVYVDPAPQQVQAPINGVNISIRATPIIYEWDFGDGTPSLRTKDPGLPYPHHSVYHEYRRAGEYSVTLNTTWQGEWSLDQNHWRPINGEVITTDQAGPLELISVRARLVTEPSQ